MNKNQRHFIDLHCDTIELGHSHILQEGRRQISLSKLQEGGAWAQFFALCPPFADSAGRAGQRYDSRDCYRRLLAVFKQEMAENADAISHVKRFAEFASLMAQGRIGAVLTVEDAVVLEDELAFLDTLYADGVRLITLTWNHENGLGYPHSADASRMALGLKPFGKDAVRRMNELGVVVDVSHLSDGGVRDVACISSAPFVASHSCARALCEHTRGLSDAMLHVLGDKGCVVGLNFNPPFVRPGSSFITAADLAQHALHIRDKAGIEALAFGSDFDGFFPNSSLSFGDYDGMPLLAAELEKYFTPAEMDLICSGNVLRLLRDVWKD